MMQKTNFKLFYSLITPLWRTDVCKVDTIVIQGLLWMSFSRRSIADKLLIM